MTLGIQPAGGGVKRAAADPVPGGQRAAGRGHAVGDRGEDRAVGEAELTPQRFVRRRRSAIQNEIRRVKDVP